MTPSLENEERKERASQYTNNAISILKGSGRLIFGIAGAVIAVYFLVIVTKFIKSDNLSCTAEGVKNTIYTIAEESDVVLTGKIRQQKLYSGDYMKPLKQDATDTDRQARMMELLALSIANNKDLFQERKYSLSSIRTIEKNDDTKALTCAGVLKLETQLGSATADVRYTVEHSSDGVYVSVFGLK